MLDGCHMCRNPEPKETMVVNMFTRGIVPEYHGVEEVIIYSKPEGSDEIVRTRIPFKPVSYSSSKWVGTPANIKDIHDLSNVILYL